MRNSTKNLGFLSYHYSATRNNQVQFHCITQSIIMLRKKNLLSVSYNFKLKNPKNAYKRGWSGLCKGSTSGSWTCQSIINTIIIHRLTKWNKFNKYQQQCSNFPVTWTSNFRQSITKYSEIFSPFIIVFFDCK